MAYAKTKPVEDTVGKVNDELAIGADLDFQRKWWRFEFGLWIFFTILIVLDLLGFFGRGYMAKAHRQTSDNSMNIGYDRVERFGTPSVLTVHFGQSVIQNGQVQLWVSEDLVKALGAQRVVPQPSESILGQGGILYKFPATAIPASAEFALQPSHAGLANLRLHVPGHDEASLKILVMP
ncbi:MAG: hypothetical protein JO108_07440 [Acidobacteriaceae bacterium]|nr:hypothetical protein [Acidobacteriaceae bacterium]